MVHLVSNKVLSLTSMPIEIVRPARHQPRRKFGWLDFGFSALFFMWLCLPVYFSFRAWFMPVYLAPSQGFCPKPGLDPLLVTYAPWTKLQNRMASWEELFEATAYVRMILDPLNTVP